MTSGPRRFALGVLALLLAPWTAAAQITLPTAPVGPPPVMAAPVVAPSWFQGGPAPPPLPPVAGVQAGPQGLISRPGEILEVVPLRYADVSEIVGLLTADQSLKPNDSFTPEEPNFGSNGGQTFYGSGGYGGGGVFPTTPAAPAFNAAGASADPLGRDVNDMIGIDRRLNAIILRGAPERVAAIKAEIASLDRPVASVVLETVFVELTETGARNLGLDLNNANNQIATANWAYSKGFPGLTDTPRSGGVSVDMQAALYAQIAKGEGRIVSKPRIAAQSGGSAKIVTGDALPILTSIAISGVNAVQQQVQYVNVGVTLQIAPRVSDDGMVTSHVYAVVSSVTGYSQGYPTISQREASTSATVRDGESFVIGGLSQETDLKHRNKLPILGDVPVLSLLFDAENSTKSKTDLYIVVTPHVVHGHGGGAPALPQTPGGP